MDASSDTRSSPDAVAPLLLAWYDRHARDLPWRAKPGETPDPYRVWLSEVMLQQTTVAAVRPRFQAWVARWPSAAALAAADEAEVMAAWAGLGYYARARNLVATAREVAARGGFPRTEAELRALPGLGAYTAAAVAAIAFGQRAVVVDANVERVVARLCAIDAPLPGARKAIRAGAEAITPDARAGDFAQATMDLGATVCTPRKPRCLLCPLREVCRAHAEGDPERLPVKPARRARPVRHGTIFWLERPGDPSCRAGPGIGGAARPPGGRKAERWMPEQVRHDGGREVLLVRRPSRGLLGGMRALPTGPWTEASAGLAGAPAAAAWRLLDAGVVHGFTHFELHLALAVATMPPHDPQPDGEWWPVGDLAAAGLPTLFAKAADEIGRAA